MRATLRSRSSFSKLAASSATRRASSALTRASSSSRRSCSARRMFSSSDSATWFDFSSSAQHNHAQCEYKHVLANILRSLFVARMPSEEARSPGRRSNVENAPRRRPITGEPATLTSHIRHTILRTPPITRQSTASSACRPRPANRSHYVVISRDGRKLVTTVRVMLP